MDAADLPPGLEAAGRDQRGDAAQGQSGEPGDRVAEVIDRSAREDGVGQGREPTEPQGHGEEVHDVGGHREPGEVAGVGVTSQRDGERDGDGEDRRGGGPPAGQRMPVGGAQEQTEEGNRAGEEHEPQD